MELNLYIYAHWDKYDKKVEYELSTYRRSDDSGHVLLEERVISFETPEEKAAKVQLSSAMNKQLSSLRAYHHVEETQLLETINEMLALEFKPAAVVEELEDDISYVDHSLRRP